MTNSIWFAEIYFSSHCGPWYEDFPIESYGPGTLKDIFIFLKDYKICDGMQEIKITKEPRGQNIKHEPTKNLQK